MNRTLVQIGLIGLCWGAAYLDLKQPGYMHFYDPIPWQMIDRVKGDWGTCPSIDKAVKVPGITAIANLFQALNTYDDWKHRLGEPACHEEADGYQLYTWKIARPAGYFVRIKFDKDGKAQSYEFLRGSGGDDTTGDRTTKPGSSVPAMAETTTVI